MLLKFSENFDWYFVDDGVEILYVMLNIGMIENKHNCIDGWGGDLWYPPLLTPNIL